MKLTNKTPFIIIITFCLTLITGVVLWSLNKEDFFKANIMQLFSLATTIMVSVIFVQHLNEKRSRREMIVKIVMDILEKIENDEDTFSKSSSHALVKQRTIANRIKYLVKYSDIPEIQEDLEEIEKAFTRTKEIFSESHQDEEKRTMGIENYKAIINDKCNKIIMFLYSKN